MKLWRLEPKGSKQAWEPWYDKAFGFVIRAETEEIARRIADSNAGDENRDGHSPWLDPSQSSCDELHANGTEGLILIDFASA